MKALIARIDEDFMSSPVDGVCVLSFDDWQTLKKELATANNNVRNEICACTIESDVVCSYCQAEGDSDDGSPCNGCKGFTHFIGRKLSPVA